MTDEKPKKKEAKTPSESQVAITGAKENAQGFVETAVVSGIKSLIQFAPFGGSGFAFFSFLLQQQWALVLITFPATILAVIWAAYSESVLTRFYEIYKARGAKDVDSLMAWIEKVDKAIKETIKWQLAGIEDKYLKIQGNTCKDFKTEGYKPGLSIFTPLLNEVFVPLDLSSAFMRNLEGKSLPLPPGFKWDKKTIELVQKDGLRIWDILKQTKKFTAYRRLAILSWGGYGKTTLLRHITYIYTNKKEGRYKAPKLLPVLILLRQWQKTIAETKDLDLPSLIEEHHIPKLPQGEELKLPPNWAKNHLKNGKMLVMFDGFDEIQDKWRTKISAWLGREMNRYPETNFILTSRPSAYNEHFLTEYKYKPNYLLNLLIAINRSDLLKIGIGVKNVWLGVAEIQQM